MPTPPSANAGFLRPDAALAIIFLANQDDCSAPAGTQLFSLGGDQNLTNPLGPLQHYRCNQFGHLCQDPAMGEAYVMPPLTPPADAQGTPAAPTLDLGNCKDNDQGTGLLTPVSQFVADLQALKSDPDNQILVASIVAPPSPYSVAWVPAGAASTQPGELWPEVEHSCGAAGGDDVNPEATMNATDGSFGDPGVRLADFANSFSQSVVASVCDPTYASTVQAIATQNHRPPQSPELPVGSAPARRVWPTDLHGHRGHPERERRHAGRPLRRTATRTGTSSPAGSWGPTRGRADGQSLVVDDAPGQPSLSVTATCSICKPGVPVLGC